MRAYLPSTLPALIAMLLSGCAASADIYPSLAIRDIERVQGTLAPPVSNYVPPPPPASALDQLDALLTQAQAAHAWFIQQAPSLSGTIRSANGSAIGSEGWARATVAVAELESVRSQAMIALADLDQIYAEAATQGQSLDRVAATRDEVIRLVEAEDRQIAELARLVAQ